MLRFVLYVVIWCAFVNITVLVTPCVTNAQSARVNVFRVLGDGALTDGHFRITLESIVSLYKIESGVTLVPRVRVVKRNICPVYGIDFMSVYGAWFCVRDYYHGKGLWERSGKKFRGSFKRAPMAHFFLPPAIYLDKYWMTGLGGMGGRCVKRTGISLSNAYAVNQDGDTRMYQSMIAGAHEIGHSLSAAHVDSITIMNPDPLRLSLTQELHFDPTSVAQIRACASTP